MLNEDGLNELFGFVIVKLLHYCNEA